MNEDIEVKKFDCGVASACALLIVEYKKYKKKKNVAGNNFEFGDLGKV